MKYSDNNKSGLACRAGCIMGDFL